MAQQDDSTFDIQGYLGGNTPPPALPQGLPAQPVFQPLAPPTPAPAAPAMGGGGMGGGALIPMRVAQMEKQLGRRLNPDELAGLGSELKTRELPKFISPKMQQWEYEQMQAGFDDAWGKYTDMYNQQPAIAGAGGSAGQGTPDGKTSGFHPIDAIATALGGAVKGVVGGGFNLGDLLARNANAVIEGARNYPELVKTFIDNGPFSKEYKDGVSKYVRSMYDARGARTFLGDIGQGVNHQTDEFLNNSVLDEDTVKGRANINAAWSDDKKNVADALGSMLANPNAAFSQLTEVAGGFLGPGALLKVKGAANFLSKADQGMRRLAGAVVIGAPQAANTVQQWAESVDQIPMDALMKVESNQQLVQEMKNINPYVDQATIEKAVRDHTRAAGYDTVVASSMLANVGFAALPYFKSIESRLAGAFEKKAGEKAAETTLQKVASTGGSELVEEAAASATEQLGQNIASNLGGQATPILQGVGKQATQGGVMGLLTGGPVAAFTPSEGATGKKENKLKPSEKGKGTPAGQVSTSVPGAPTEAPTPAQAAEAPAEVKPSDVPVSATPNATYEQKKKGFVTALNEDASLKRSFKNATLDDATAMVDAAQDEAHQRLKDIWPTLDNTQRRDAIRTVVELANKARGKNAITEGIDDAINAVVPEHVAEVPKPAEVPLTPGEARADVPAAEAPTPSQPKAIVPIADVPVDEAPQPQQLSPGTVQVGTPDQARADAERLTKETGATHVAVASGSSNDDGTVTVTWHAIPEAEYTPYKQATPAAEAPVTPPVAPPVTKQLTPVEKQAIDDQRFFEGLARWNEPANAQTEGLRDRPEYGPMVQAYKEGKITSLGEFRTQLKAVKEAIKNAPPKVDWTVSGEGRTQRIGDLLGMKGNLKASVRIAKQHATAAKAALTSMGMKPEEVDALNLKGAMDAYARMTAQGLRPAADVARPQVEEKTAPKETPAKEHKTKGTLKKGKQVVKPDGTVEIKTVTPEPHAVAGVNESITSLKDKNGQRIKRGQQIEVQRLFDLVSRTGQYSADLRKAVTAYGGTAEQAKAIDNEAGEVFSKRATATAEETQAAKEKTAREKPTTEPKKGKRAAGVRNWIANLHQPGGTGVRIAEDVQKNLENLYSRMLVKGGTPSQIYNAVEQATGNADVAQDAADRYSKEFEGLGDTPNVLALAKLADVGISAPRARMLTDIADEQPANFKAEDGRSAMEVAVDAARRLKGDKLATANKAELRQAFDREASRPKTKAPAQTKATGAESSQKAESKSQQQQAKSSEPSAAELAQKVDPVAVQAEVLNILGDKALSNSMVREIADAVTQSRLDESTGLPELRKLVNELLKEGDIDLAQAKALRDAGKQVELTSPSLRTTEEMTAEEKTAPEPTADTGEDALAYAAQQQEDGPTRAALNAALSVTPSESGHTLLRAIASMKSITPAQRWLANKLANMIQSMDIGLRQPNEGEHADWKGWYSKDSNEVVIRVAHPATVLHEYLHAVTAYAIENQLSNPDVKRLVSQLRAIRMRVATFYAENPGAVDDVLSKVLDSKYGPLNGPIDEMLTYGLTHEPFQNLLSLIPQAGESKGVWGAFKKALGNFLKVFTGQQRSLLDAIIDTSGQLVDLVETNPNLNKQVQSIVQLEPRKQYAKAELAMVNDSAPAEDEDTHLDMSAKDSTWRRFGVRFVNQALGLEQVQQTLIAAGRTIGKKLDIARAKVLSDGLKNEYTGHDTFYYVNPVLDMLRGNLSQFGENREQGLENINKFFRNKTQLNRYHMMYLENVRLNAGKDVQRQKILEKVRNTSGTDKAAIKELRGQLERLVSQYSVENEETYATKQNQFYPRFKESLKELSDQWGIDEESMAPLNARMQGVRDQIQVRAVQSGKADVHDPWIEFYDDKYYVPLKGEKDVPNNIQDLDFGAVDADMSMKIFNSSLKVAKGTKKSITNGIERLLTDSVMMSTKAAEQSLNQTLYDFTMKFKDDLGASVRVYEGRPKDGYVQTSGPGTEEGEPTLQSGLPFNEDGFTFNDGDTHYVVKLPKNSDLTQAIKETYASSQSWATTILVGKATNFLSKSYTVWKPWWTLTTALLRDVTYVPAMLGVKDESVMSGLGMMGKYYKALTSNAFQLSNVQTAYNMIFTEDQAALERHAAANEGSYVDWLLRYQKAGGGSNIRAMFNQTGLRKSMTSGYSNADGLWKLALPARLYDKWSTGLGNLLENTSRVAGFRAVVEDSIQAYINEHGVEPEGAALREIEQDAAVTVKDVLNYDQKGVWSRGVNSYLAFFKVGMTSADAMRKAFTEPDGSFAKARFAKWAGVFSAMAFVGMSMARKLGGQDDDEKDKLSKIDINTLTQNFIVFVDGKPHKLPIGLGLPQLLLAPGIIFESMQNGDITPSEAGRALYETFARNAPMRPGGLADDWTMADFGNSMLSMFTPTVVAPIQQLSTNTNAFGQNIHRDFTGSEQYASEQGKLTTDDVWKDMAKEARERFGVDAFPETYKTIFGTYLSHIPIDKIAKVTAAADEADFPLLAGAKEIAGVEVRDPEYYYARQLNKVSDALLPAVQEFNLRKNQNASSGMSDKAARAAAENWINSQGELGAQYRAYKALDKAQRAYYNERKKIYRNKALSVSRREMMMKQLDSQLRKAVDAAQKSAPE